MAGDTTLNARNPAAMSATALADPLWLPLAEYTGRDRARMVLGRAALGRMAFVFYASDLRPALLADPPRAMLPMLRDPKATLERPFSARERRCIALFLCKSVRAWRVTQGILASQ